MSTAQEAPEAATEDPRFENRIDPRWALSLEQVLAVAVFGALFVMLSYIPLRASDLWGHVAYGQWILDHRQLPTEDPFMSLARGMQVIDTAWLSQVILGAIDRYLGPEAISHLFAVLGLATYLVWARVFYLQSHRVWLAALGTLLLIFVGWSRLATVRPETFAVLCGAVLYLLITRHMQRTSSAVVGAATVGAATVGAALRRFNWATWIGVPLVMAAWANLHGSFVVGLLVLGCFLAGRVIEVLWQSRSMLAVLRDAEARRWLYLTEIALLATLINPYGIDLWIHTVRFGANPNMATVLEWQPLVILGTGGRQFAISIVLLLVVWRHSRRPIRPAEVLLLATLAAATIGGIRMIGWYAPALIFVLMPHLADIVQRLWPRRTNETTGATTAAGDGETLAAANVPLPGHSFRYSLIALLLVWIAFAFSPISQPVLRARPPRTAEQLYGTGTPVALMKFLNEPPVDSPLARQGHWNDLVFHPQWWGDWLDRAGPRDFKPFATTNIHLVPRQVWSDYNRVLQLRSGWERTLDRYRVGTIVVDKKEQAEFLATLSRHSDWQKVYEDDQAAVFVVVGDRSRSSENAEPPVEEAI